MNKLSGKVALITGGASGIGEATARLFVEEGASVTVADIQDERGQRIVTELGAAARYVHVDVTREVDVQAAIDVVVAQSGRLDCLFNNAGGAGAYGLIEDISVAGFDATMALLFRSVFLGMKYAAPVMKRQGGGSIISTASVAGLRAAGSHIYSAAKAAVIHLTRSVAMELGESGVRVNCICPGGIATPIFGKALGLAGDAADATVPVMKKVLTTFQPIRRCGLPEDVARAALWLASEESSFVNGHALVVDGGLSAGWPLWSEVQRRRALLRKMMGLASE
jgi:NAD(P)-dependent dehydrogenase (short-subunit alcohol dehydrogenase family)